MTGNTSTHTERGICEYKNLANKLGIWSADFANVQLISKYAWLVLLKDKNRVAVTHVFSGFWTSLIANQTRYR